MQIQLNGQARDVPEQCTAEMLIELMGLTGKRLAMEVNREIVPRSTFASHLLNPNDQVEIVHAIGGG